VSQPPPRPPQPGIAQAIGLLLIGLIVQFVFLIPFAIAGLGSHPAAFAVVNLVTAVVLIRLASRLSGASVRQLLPVRAVPVSLLLAMAVTVVGLSVVLSEVDNLLREVLPVPAGFAAFMQAMMGGQQSLWGSILLVSIVAPLWEEAFCRGVLLHSFVPRYGVRKAIVASTVIFAVYHGNPWQLAGAAAAGWLFAWCFVRTGSLVPCIVGHAVNNSVGFVFDALSVKIPGYSTGLTAVVQHQPLWFDAIGAGLVVMGLLWLRRSIDTVSRSPAAAR
jgi:hypothetical protein